VRTFLSDFKKFILRGNVIDLAVAVVVGAAFTKVVQSFADNIVMGFVGAIFGQTNFNDVTIHVGHGRVFVGIFITALVNFLIVGFAVFLAVKAFEAMQKARRKSAAEGDKDVDVDSDFTVDQELLMEIRDLLRDRAAS
jgi:large conductance mechanosensitive channel